MFEAKFKISSWKDRVLEREKLYVISQFYKVELNSEFNDDTKVR